MVWDRLWPNPGRAYDASTARGISQNSASLTLSVVRPLDEFVEVEVQKGDWLHKIGRRYNVDLRSILKANPSICNPNLVKVGSCIKIPRASTTIPRALVANGSSLVSPISSKTSRNIASPIKSFMSVISVPQKLKISNTLSLLTSIIRKREKDYKVKEGDNLEWLAEKFGTSVKSIKRLNNIQDDIICTGSILKIESSRAHEQRSVLGRKANASERSAAVEGIRVDNHIKPLAFNPVFKVRLPDVQNQKWKHFTPKTVKVRYGDTLADIADANGLTIRELQRLNHLRDDVIYDGDVLAVSAGASKTDTSDLRPGKRRTNRPLFSRQVLGGLGVGGPNSLSKTGSTKDGDHAGRWKKRRKGFKAEEKWMRFSTPLTEGFVSSPFGWRWGAFHEGLDLAAEQGSPILASDRGTVVFAGWSGGYGYLLSIQHEGGFTTRYAHCCSIHARVGQQVVRGQHVAAVGSTGRSSGPHLHFEVRRNGEALDPFQWVYL